LAFLISKSLVSALLKLMIMSTIDKKNLVPDNTSPVQDTERLLLERLRSSATEEDYFRWMLFIVGYYRSIRKTESAVALLQDFLKKQIGDGEKKAHCQLALGQIATDDQRMEAALEHFQAALECQPKKRKVTYVIHNNIGYCLNRLARFKDAEKHCRMAIEVNWKRASGYRNLGVSLEGQGDLTGAAWVLVEAIKLEVSDERARALLEKFIAEHPAMIVRCPWIVQGLYPDLSKAETLPV
jgi:tetratricopeptide (TPR) repeat protein